MLVADIAEAVDLDWSLVDEKRAQFAASGACEIPNFVRADALPAFVEDAHRVAARAFRSGTETDADDERAVYENNETATIAPQKPFFNPGGTS